MKNSLPRKYYIWWNWPKWLALHSKNRGLTFYKLGHEKFTKMKHSSLFTHASNVEEVKFYMMSTCCWCFKTFFHHWWRAQLSWSVSTCQAFPTTSNNCEKGKSLPEWIFRCFLALPTNIRTGRKGLPGWNTLAYLPSSGWRRRLFYGTNTRLANNTAKTGCPISMPWYIPNRARRRIGILMKSVTMVTVIFTYSVFKCSNVGYV